MEKKISDAQMKKIQEVCMDILDKFVEVCEKLDLKYSLGGGSLLGAVRHKGFIPWDDDIDLMMFRDEYEIFLKEAPKLLPEGYELQHFSNSKYAVHAFARIRRSDTAWIHFFDDLKPDNNLGIAIDIFPIDRIENEKSQKKLEKKIKILFALRWAHCPKTQYKSKAKAIIGKLFCFPIARILGRRGVNKIQDRLEKKFNHGEYACADMFKRKHLLPYSFFEEFIELDFEGKKYSCIKEYDAYLTAIYGDYMKLPPEEKRVTLVAEIMDCDKSYLNYIKNK